MTNRKQKFLSPGLAAMAFVATTLVASVGWSQCNGSCGGSSSSHGACSGRCTYGVEGVCAPKRRTFGYHDTTWRRWPEPAPAVPERIQSDGDRNRQGVPGQLDLPESIDESDADPEFAHLKSAEDDNDLTSGDDFGSYDSYESFASPGTSEDYILKEVAPSSPSTMDYDEDDGGAVDLPQAELEGAIDAIDGLDGLDDLDGSVPPSLDLESRNARARNTQVAGFQSDNRVGRVGNPLRFVARDTRSVERATTIQTSATMPHPVQADVAAAEYSDPAGSRYGQRNPLR